MTNVYRQPTRQRREQRGAAALLAVVFLYVAMAIIVVFANRNLIFEQKTSANQYRATMALEAAEAGLEWATTMLNKSGRISGACVDSASAGDSSFIDKYLSYSAVGRTWTPASTGTVVAACVTSLGGSDWTCSCPAAGTAPTAAAPAAGGFKPGFSIAFITNTATRAVDLVSYGCTSVVNSATCTGDAAATVRVTLASTSALATAPGAPLTARGRVNVGNAALGVQNGDPVSGGVTVNAGMDINATSLRITTTPGTPPSSTLIGNDASLRTTTEDQMFQTYFGVPKQTWKDSVADAILGPTGTVGVTRVCSPCTETDVSAVLTGDSRKIWVEGNLAMNSNDTLGAFNDPFLMVVNGSISMRGDLNVYGVLYSTAINWDNTGGGGALLSGAAISEGNYTGNGTPDYYYDPRVINNLREIPGPFVRVPGSWRDF